jgi:hypothetical protein
MADKYPLVLYTNEIKELQSGDNLTGITIDLATSTTGTLAVTSGGTGQTSYTDGQLLIGNTTGNTLVKATLTAGTGISITNGTGSITVAATNNGTVTSVDVSGGTTGLTTSGGPITGSGTITIAGTLAVANGGTGITSFGTGVATALGQNVSGSGSIALTTSPVFTTPSLGNATATQINITAQGAIRLEDTTGGEYMALRAPGTVTSSTTLTLPNGAGSNGQVLTTDGSGTLSWAAGGISTGKSIAMAMIFGF